MLNNAHINRKRYRINLNKETIIIIDIFLKITFLIKSQ
jgi:hypothetical protein